VEGRGWESCEVICVVRTSWTTNQNLTKFCLPFLQTSVATPQIKVFQLHLILDRHRNNCGGGDELEKLRSTGKRN
jgi:hypothetical protein